MKLEQIKALDKKHIAQTFSRYDLAFAKARGAQVWDTEGKRYLDLLGGVAVNGLGLDLAVQKAALAQMKAWIHSSNLYYSGPQALLARELTALSFADRVFFANTGAEAIEVSIKLARRWGHLRLKGAHEIIALKGSFHGRTTGALAATGQARFHQGLGPLLPGIKFAPPNDLKAMARLMSGKTCAVLAEPVMGEGGIHVLDKAYLKGLRALCDRRHALLILDEIQTGLGRTGKLFAYQHYGITPDLMPLGKSLGGGFPLSVVLATEEAAAVFGPGDHGTTLGGNPVACAAGLALLKAVQARALPAHAAKLGQRMKAAFEAARRQGAPILAVRGLGLMLGVQLSGPARPVVDALQARGLLANATAGDVLRLLPPLNITQAQADRAVAIILSTLKDPAVAAGLNPQPARNA
jgi:predicted acetylornithine/succinylornithine family transaminase